MADKQYDTPLKMKKPTWKDGVCPKCSKTVPAGTQGAYFWNGQVYHPECNPTPSSAGAANAPPVAMQFCDLCGQKEPENEFAHYYTPDRSAYRVCRFCRRVLACQEQAKRAGLWIVHQKKADATTTDGAGQ